MRLPRVQFTVRQTMIGVALLACIFTSGIELARRSPFRFDFYDYDVLDDEPLVNQTEFFGLKENRVDLGPAGFLEVEATTWAYADTSKIIWSPVDRARLTDALQVELARMRAGGAPGVVDLRPASDGRTLLYVRHRPWYCGTCLGPAPIHIPLFRRTVFRNRRLLIGIGTLRSEARTIASMPSN
jgi:hypothetical protein